MFNDVRTGRAQLAAAGLTITESRSRAVRFSPPYKEVSQVLLYNSRTEAPTRIQDLIGTDLLVISQSAHAERLRELQRHRSEEHTSELQSRGHLVCRLLLEKKNKL